MGRGVFLSLGPMARLFWWRVTVEGGRAALGKRQQPGKGRSDDGRSDSGQARAGRQGATAMGALLAVLLAAPVAAQMPPPAALLPALQTSHPASDAIPGSHASLWHNVAVLGRDDRRPLPKRYRQMQRKIGILHNPLTNTLCSAFCVRPNVIATAAHCFFSRKNGQPLKLSAFRFTLNYGRSTTRPGASSARLAGYQTGMSRLFIAAGTSGLRRRPPIGAIRDWALARLATPHCRFGTIDIKPHPVPALIRASKQRRILQLAFHLDFKNWRLAYSQPCQIKRNFGNMRWSSIKAQFVDPEDLVLHTCDTAGASSGSPILMESDAGLVAVAINVGTYQQRNVLIRDGRVVKRSKYRTIANTAVNAHAFADLASYLEHADIIASRGDLMILQQRLQALGLYGGPIDGLMGRQTERAIKTFERRQNWPVTGLATRPLLAALGEPAAENISTTSMITIIEDGKRLMALQERLRREGLYAGKIDGIMGEKTEAGIRAFQARLQIPVTGLATTDLLNIPPNATTPQDRGTAP